jgi:hypothetical protein
MPHNIYWVDELMCSDHHITREKLCCTLSIGKGSVVAVIEEVSSSEYCSLGVLASHFNWM